MSEDVKTIPNQMPSFIALSVTLRFDMQGLEMAIERVKAEGKKRRWRTSRAAAVADFAEAILQDHLMRSFGYEEFDAGAVAEALKNEGWFE